MPKIKIPFKGKLYQNVDEIELNEFTPLLIDGWVDEFGFTHKRPGLVQLVDLGTSAPVDGVFWDDVFGCLYAVSNGKIFKVTDKEGTNSDITGDALLAGSRPSFVQTGTYAVFANGSKMVYYDNSDNTAFIPGAVAPDEVTHLAFLDGYLIANHINDSKFYFAADILSWNALDFATAESKPDFIRAIGVAWNELLLAGNQSMEFWQDDGVSPFSRLSGALVERGIGSIYTLKLIDNNWFFIDSERRLIRLEGRSPKVISTPIEKQLQTGAGIAGIMADHITVGGKALYALHCPDDDLTYVYDYKNNDWALWGKWDSESAIYNRWLGNTVAYSPAWNLHIVGSRVDGKLYKMSDSYYDDAGATIRTIRRSPYTDHDTYVQKRCNALTFKFKRGVGLSGDSPHATLRWRDDGSKIWSNEVMIDLGAIGETEALVTIGRLGIYRLRQYELVMSDAAPFILMDCEADIELLRW